SEVLLTPFMYEGQVFPAVPLDRRDPCGAACAALC
ncbi:hypothetical protein PF008_g19483, partial [Phytophthora fragariae]